MTEWQEVRITRSAVSVSAPRIIESDQMVERILYARSPSRALRRMRRGFPQHYVTRPMRHAVTLPNGDIVMHAALVDQLRREVSARHDRLMEKAFFGTLYGVSP